MTASQRNGTESRWLALLALPVLCCAGHAVLLAVGVGSVTALAGGSTAARTDVIAISARSGASGWRTDARGATGTTRPADGP